MQMLGRNAIVSTVIFGILFTLPGLLPGMSAATAQAQSPQQTLNQYVADLQKNPNDYALRERIIKNVQAMKKAPDIPEKAREHYVMAATFAEKAKDNSGYERAIEQYRAALLAAPWWADAYKRLALTQKAAARYDEAIANLSLYVLTQPPDAREARDEIYKLKALKQTAADDQLKKQKEKESSLQAIAAKQQNQAEEFFQRVVGARYIWHVNWVDYEETFSVDIYGDKVVFGTTPTRVSRGAVLPSNLSLGVYTELWPCPITKKAMRGSDLVIEVGGCWGMQGYTMRNNGGSLTLISSHYKRGYWQNAVFTRSR